MAPELNPDRHVMWMPPGYMIVNGLVFKLTGFSFTLARALSAACVMAGTVVLAVMLRRYRHAYLYLLLCGCLLLSRDFVYAGNIARMEGLLFLLAAVGFLLMQRDRLHAGLALVGVTPLVHPNGLFLCAGAGVYAVLQWLRHPERRVPSATGAILLTLSATAWLGYLAYVAAHWHDFLDDMLFQISWRGIRASAAGLSGRWLNRDMLLLLALSGAALAYGVRKRVEATFLLAFAIPLGVLSIVTVGVMYEIYATLSVGLACVVSVEIGARLAEDVARDRVRTLARVLHASVLLGGVTLAASSGRLENPLSYPHELSLNGMRIASEVAYYTQDDERIVRRFLRTLESSGTPVSVAFYPAAEALLFLDLRSESLRFMQPTFHAGRADVHVVHLSRYMPRIPEQLTRAQIAFQSGASLPLDRWPILHQRDGTERWLVYSAGVGSP